MLGAPLQPSQVPPRPGGRIKCSGLDPRTERLAAGEYPLLVELSAEALAACVEQATDRQPQGVGGHPAGSQVSGSRPDGLLLSCQPTPN